MRNLSSVIANFIALGYELRIKDGERYVQLFRSFGNEETPISGGAELQIGRVVEVYNNQIYLTPYVKRGHMWASSAVTFERKGNVYTTTNSKRYATF